MDSKEVHVTGLGHSMEDIHSTPTSDDPDFYDDEDAPAHHESAVVPLSEEESVMARPQEPSTGSLLATAIVSDVPQPEMVAHVAGVNGTADMDGADSSSEMDVSAPSTAPSRAPSLSADVQEPSTNRTKRKLSAVGGDQNMPGAGFETSAKKVKVFESLDIPAVPSPPARRWPPEMWQQVFLRLSPAELGRCLRVSKEFNRILTQIKPQPAARKGMKKLLANDSETIWTEARKNAYPNMPRPLFGQPELWMFQLLGNRVCMFCRKEPVPAPSSTPFNTGPGMDGVRIIWPFGIRTCGQCWELDTLKDVQILVSPAAKLRFGLAYAFQTPDLHFVPDLQRQQPGAIPSHLRVQKVYYKPDIEAIQAEYDEVKGYGEGTADEWQKGLVTRGKEKMADAARWERWEQQLRFGTDNAHILREYDLSSFPRYAQAVKGKSAAVSTTQPASMTNGTYALPQPMHQVLPNGYGPPFQTHHLPFMHAPRPPRNPMEVEEARAARKADIERRCLQLAPPLTPSVLQHIDSFQAAMQITTPMNDAQWDMLRPRLQAQREPAELIEHLRAEQLAALQAAIPSANADDNYLRPAKEVYDRDYELWQDPLRKRLAQYADELINGQWHGGKGLDHDSAPSLATQVMLHVRKRYVEEKQAGTLPPVPEKETKSAGSKQGTPAPDPFLSLDNMKWVHDNKIRPLTDPHRRELFLCAGCTMERRPKWFAFEGLIQHCGAKHTTAFSKGNIVVHWQTSEWPEESPFVTNPAPYVKLDRKMSDVTVRRLPRAPQQDSQANGVSVNHDSGIMLSDNPLFTQSGQMYSPSSNGYHGAPMRSPHPQQNQGQYGSQRSNPNHSPAVPQPTASMGYDAQLNQFAADARNAWDTLDGVKDLHDCIRVHSMIHHAVVRFTERFQQRPKVDMLTDSLATHTAMRPIKNAHGLACKICVGAQTDGSANSQSYFARIKNVKLYNLSALVTHFKIIHQPRQQATHVDWTRDMVELPDMQLVGDLVRTPGMDDDKLAIIAAAFPTAYADPLPKIGQVKEALPDVGPDSGLASRLLQRLEKKGKQGAKKKAQHGNGTPGREGSQDLPEPGEDEYDPRKPMVAQTKEQAADPARFDTDIARKPSAPAASVTNGTPFSLAPETLAALTGLSAILPQTAQPAPAMPEISERSPSVGRVEPTQTPDISAILASLTGVLTPARPATTSTAPTRQVASAPRAHHGHPQAQAEQRTHVYRPESRRASGRYVPETAPRASVSPPRSAHHDLQATLARNTSQYQQNQKLQAYTAAPSQSYHQPQRSPPRYRVMYEDEHAYGQPRQQPKAPAYCEAPVQYVQLPEHQPPSQYVQYGYERPAPSKPVYVDQYGRPLELIPIDAAPAPVQYAPHPYDQQQQQAQQQYGHRPEPAKLPYGQPQSAGMQYQPAYPADGRAMYYGQASPTAATPGGHALRYVYDDGARSSVPRS
ncbi:hypothetical protein BAUCODRAFT_37134 [Baudoinia panamericana UAMH 10762]|uniref:Uncharacterized protein n=1 Tax=Baudoinia panamericana (strain UAMH 10762) TaxID=717646 RepID=M2N428_BAUPA|nr:uncharacterized protein BAUCODRAFT_37134 [Baudoinia panamericana UAMH 10762]EMC93455.1 hypothetical protein BAUCODRAFT_37134 [Baudoinia panamericana UAMH 10762]